MHLRSRRAPDPTLQLSKRVEAPSQEAFGVRVQGEQRTVIATPYDGGGGGA